MALGIPIIQHSHLGYIPHARDLSKNGNTRNGTSAKTIQTNQGPVELNVPRDRAGTFEPAVVPKRQRRLEGFDDKVLARYVHGLTTREIQGHLKELYGTDVSPTLVSTITDAVLEDVRLWQSRPLETVYPILHFDYLFVKSRHEGAVKTKAVYVALGVNLTGEKELLDLWVSETEGATFWLAVFTDLQQRGVQDCFVACVDGLAGLSEARETVFPQARSNSALCLKFGNHCGMWSGKSGERWSVIYEPSMEPRRSAKRQKPLSNVLAGGMPHIPRLV